METSSAERTCFVLTTAAPADTEISQHNDGLVEYVIGPAVRQRGYRVVRMDAVSAPGTISDAAMRHLRVDDLVIADLSFDDPNVMYALGVRHSLDRPVIHVLTPSSTFPFDLAGLEAVTIDLTDLASARTAGREIDARLAALEESPSTPSPVLATIDIDTTRRASDPTELVPATAIATGIRSIERQLELLQIQLSRGAPRRREANTRSRRVFIVHGHDGELKHELARFLDALDFEVVILQELADSGRTLLEKLRAEVEDIGFVFVLLTPDDHGHAHRDPGDAADRPRQNVVYEHGLFCGLVGHERVCAIQRGDVELPSDLRGLVVKRIPDGGGLEAIQVNLLRELKRAGYDVDANQLVT